MKRWLIAAALCCGTTAFAQATQPVPGWTRAQVVALDAAQRRITLKHAPIETPKIVMDAMTMPFRVIDAKALATLKPGDAVRFQVDLVDDEPVVTRIEAVR